MHAILFNGPPGSGKDTAAAMVMKMVGAMLIKDGRGEAFDSFDALKFSEPLKNACHALLGLPRPHDYYEAVKDEAVRDFFGMTPREWYIGMSEKFAKQFAGTEFFGNVMVRELAQRVLFGQQSALVAFSDSGFVSEILPVVRALMDGDHFLIVQVYRPGRNYSGDSRGYVERDHIIGNLVGESSDLGQRVGQITIQNDGDLQQFADRLKDKVQSWINHTTQYSSSTKKSVAAPITSASTR